MKTAVSVQRTACRGKILAVILALFLVTCHASRVTAADTVNEKSIWVVACTFSDEAGAPVTPASGTYRIDDDSGVEITDDTPFTPSSSTHTIVITPNENRILVAANLREFRRVTVTFVYGSGKQGTGEYRYNVVNLQGVQ